MTKLHWHVGKDLACGEIGKVGDLFYATNDPDKFERYSKKSIACAKCEEVYNSIMEKK
jgi:hypothetical protein